MRNVPREQIHSALVESNGNLGDAAKKLGIAKTTIYRRVVEYGWWTVKPYARVKRVKTMAAVAR